VSLSQPGAELQGVSLNSAVPWSMPPPWVRACRRAWLGSDLTAGLVVAVMLVPQSLAYAMLAGLPPHVGLMASFLPLLGYAVFGSSTSMSVGPAAITSLMMVQALTPLAVPGSEVYVASAAALGLGSGLLMLLMGRLRMGFLSQLLGRPVVQGFTVASALLIMAGQVAPILGWSSLGQTVPDLVAGVRQHLVDSSGAWRWDVQTGSVLIGLGDMAVVQYQGLFTYDVVPGFAALPDPIAATDKDIMTLAEDYPGRVYVVATHNQIAAGVENFGYSPDWAQQVKDRLLATGKYRQVLRVGDGFILERTQEVTP